jgi:hypothetical protein
VAFIVLTVQRCRDILGPYCPLTDRQIAELCSQLYGLADLALLQVAQSANHETASDDE